MRNCRGDIIKLEEISEQTFSRRTVTAGLEITDISDTPSGKSQSRRLRFFFLHLRVLFSLLPEYRVDVTIAHFLPARNAIK